MIQTPKAFIAGGTVPARTIVKFSSGKVIVGAAATDLLIGVTDNVDVVTDESVDVHLIGPTPVVYGGNVTEGQDLTSDGTGKAVYANPATGVNNVIIGYALKSGVSGDIGLAMLNRSVKQGL